MELNKKTMDNIDGILNGYHYKGYGIHDSMCDIRIRTVRGVVYILFEDTGNGTSVTNASEDLATEIINKFNLEPQNCRFFETYSQYNYDSIDEIEYKWSFISEQGSDKLKHKAEQPRWRPSMGNFHDFFGIIK